MSNNEKPEDLSGIKTARFVFCLKTSDPDNRTQTESYKKYTDILKCTTQYYEMTKQYGYAI